MKDNHGNELYNNGGAIMLRLAGEEKPRRIGRINKATRELSIVRGDRHIYRKANSYGLCYELLRTATQFDTIRLGDEHGHYSIPIEVWRDEGEEFKHFKKEGFELQKFLKLETIRKYRI